MGHAGLFVTLAKAAVRMGVPVFVLLASGAAAAQSCSTPAEPGQVAADNCSTTFAGGSYATTGNSVAVFDARNGGAINATAAVTLSSSGGGSRGAYAQSGGAITLNGGSITTSGMLSDTLLSQGNNSTITATAMALTATGAVASGANAREGGSVAVHGGAISNTAASGTGSVAAGGVGSQATADQGLRITTFSVGAWAGAFDYYASATQPGASVSLDTVTIQDIPTASSASGVRADGVFVDTTSSVRSTLDANKVSINLSSDMADGGALAYAGAKITIRNSDVATSGIWSNGLHASFSKDPSATPPILAEIAATNVTVNTTGGSSVGAYAHNGSLITLNNVDVTTAGDYAYGLVGEGYLSDATAPVFTGITGTGVTVHTTGAAAYGAMFTDSSALDLTDSTIAADDAGAGGVYVRHLGSTATLLRTPVTAGLDAGRVVDSGQFQATDSALTGGRHGVSSTGGTAADPNVISVSGGTLAFGSGDAFNAANTNAQITLKNGATVTPAGRNLLNVTGASNVTFNVQAITAAGDIVAAAAANTVATVFLQNNSAITGIQSNTWTTIEPGSKWTMNGNSVIHSLANKGTAVFDPNGTNKTLTTGNYVGAGGTLGINTYFDGSGGGTSDVLVIKDGGSATGTTTIAINPSGPGSSTGTGDGILIVQALGNATVDKNAFIYTPLTRGGYEYDLVQGRLTNPAADTQNLYLRSKAAPPSAATAVPTLNPAALGLLALGLAAVAFLRGRRNS